MLHLLLRSTPQGVEEAVELRHILPVLVFVKKASQPLISTSQHISIEPSQLHSTAFMKSTKKMRRRDYYFCSNDCLEPRLRKIFPYFCCQMKSAFSILHDISSDMAVPPPDPADSSIVWSMWRLPTTSSIAESSQHQVGSIHDSVRRPRRKSCRRKPPQSR
jgi:hypothetical protein